MGLAVAVDRGVREWCAGGGVVQGYVEWKIVEVAMEWIIDLIGGIGSAYVCTAGMSSCGAIQHTVLQYTYLAAFFFLFCVRRYFWKWK